MAVSNSNYFKNSIIGVPQLGADIDLYESSSSPKYAVGFGFTRADGNKYRYCHFGALSNRGTLVATDVSESGATKIENVGALVANVTKKSGENLNPNAIGSQYLQLVITATAHQFAGAYLTITTGAGAGFTYRIKDNTADTAGPVTGNLYMDLYDKVVVAIDSTSDITIAGCPYSNVEGATVTDRVPAGVTVTNNSITSWGWVVTHGITGVLQDVSIGTIGGLVTVSSNTTGAISIASSTVTVTGLVLGQIGYLVEAGSSADYSLVYLGIE